MDIKCGVGVIVKPNSIELIFKKYYNTSRIDISKSGKYMVRSGLYKIFLTDFETNKRINAVNGYGYIINGISDNDKHCVFTSNGERRINILSIPDLKEIACLDTGYISGLKFCSDSEVVYFSRKIESSEYTLNVWDFLTGETKIIFDNAKDNSVPISHTFDTDSFILFSCCHNNFQKGKIKIIKKRQITEYQIDGEYDFYSVSQPNENKILISKHTDDKYIVGIYDLVAESFTPIIERENYQLFLFWLSDNLFLFSELKNKNTSIMNLNGEIITLVDDFSHIAPCSNDKYLLCYNPSGTYLFEKSFGE